MSVGSTREQNVVRTREAIVEAARLCFARKGYSGASMDLIAAEAGVTKPTVYAHFGTKAGLFEQLIRDDLAAHRKHPTPTVLSSSEISEALYQLSRQYLDWLLAESRIGLLRAAAPETIRRPDWAESLLEGLETSSLAVWLDELRQAEMLEIADPVQAARLHLASLKGTLFYPALLGLVPVAEPAERDRVAQAATDTFLAAYPPAES